MQKIGEGWQYTVYELTPLRVRKIAKSWFAHAQRIKSSSEKPVSFFSLFTQIQKSHLGLTRSIKKVKEIIAHNGPKELFGNPTFSFGVNYDQDKVVTLGNALQTATYSEKVHLLNRYTSLLHQLWKLGISDTVFNFTINCAIDKHNNVIMIDLGEFETSKEKIIENIQNQKWLTQWSYTTLKDNETKELFREIMNKEVTLNNLNTYWKNLK